MHRKNHANVLLVEILIAVLFFMLSSTVLVKLFVAAKNQSRISVVTTNALAEAQNVADQLKASETMEEALEVLQFDGAHGVWVRDYGDYVLKAEGTRTPYGAGELWSGAVTAYYQLDRELFSLPCERYWEGTK